MIGAADGVYAEAIAARPGLARIDEIETVGPFLSALCERDRARPSEVERRALAGDAAAPPLAEKAYDAALVGLELHAMDDPLGALIQLRRALRPNGFLLAALFAGESLTELRQALAAAEPGGPPRVAPMGEIRDLGGLLQRSGFAMPVADVERLTIWHSSPLAVLKELRAMGETSVLKTERGPLSRTPLSRRTLERLVEVYAERFSRADGKVRTTVEIAILTGWRPGPNQPLPKRPGSATARIADALGVSETGLEPAPGAGRGGGSDGAGSDGAGSDGAQ